MSVAPQYHILCVEDMQPNRQLLKMIFDRRKDINISFATHGKAGIDAAKTTLPDLILLDISLPDIDGYEVLFELRSTASTKDIPVVAISGDIPKNQGEDATTTFDAFLPKPLEVTALYDTVDRLLGIKAQ